MDTASQSLPSEVYTTLKKKIINFELMPGQLLIVQDVAKEFNMSRTPVREAMVRLRGEGLLVDSTGRKFKVSNISWDFICGLYQARKLIEEYSIDILSKQMPDGFMEKMRDNMTRMRENLDKKDYYAVFEDDADFHKLIVDASGNVVIREWVEDMYDQQMRVRFLSVSVGNRLEKTLEEHKAVYDAIDAGDFEHAKILLKQHLQNTVDELESYRADKMSLVATVVK